MRKFNVIAGLPRSGSTLLCNVLNMNSKNHATETSPVLGVLNNIKASFSHEGFAKPVDRLSKMEQIRLSMKGFLDGYYANKEVVFDKNRGWTYNINFIDAVLDNTDTKIIWTYRNPVEIISSIYNAYNKTILLEGSDEINNKIKTLDSFIQTMVGENSIIASPVVALKDVIDRGYSDRLMFVRYNDLIDRTQEVMNQIHDFIGEEHYQYDKNDFKDLKQTTVEHDDFYNYKFSHNIKEGSIKRSETKLIQNTEIINLINHKFQLLNSIIS